MTPNDYAELSLALQDARSRIDRALTLLAKELPRIEPEPVRGVTGANVAFMGAKLRRWRKANDLSLRQMRELCGISIPYLSDLERGKLVNPSWKTIKAIADAMGVQPSELFPS